MMTCKIVVLSLVVLLGTGVGQAQDNPQPSGDDETISTPCLVDDHLSVWLSLETADRMIAVLERERRELAEELARHSATLKRITEGKTGSETVERTRTGVPKSIKTVDRETLGETCEQLEARLAEVNQTLKRRRMQRVRIEEWLNVYLDVRAVAGP